MARPILDHARLKADFDRDGYIAITPLFDAEAMSGVNAVLDDIIAKTVPTMPRERAFFERKGDPSTLKQASNMHEYSPYLNEMLTTGTLAAIAQTLLGETASPKNVQYFNKPAGIGQPTPPHQDGYYWHLTPCRGLTFWLALEPVDEENGCIHYLRGSHRAEGFRPHGRSKILGFSQGITDFGTADDTAATVRFPGPAGTCLVHDAKTVHWAGANVSSTRSRRALGFVYFGESARVDEAKRDAYKAKLEAEMKADNQI